MYEGNMNYGCLEGKGTLKCFNGIVYTGDFK